MNSQEYLRNYNLVSTKSVGRIEDVLYQDNNLASINYGNCINIHDLINDFNKEYQEFKKDYSKLSTIDILSDFNIISYYETPNFQTLRYINDFNMIYFLNIGNSYKLVKSDISNIEGKENLNIDVNIARSYLDFGRKYQDLLTKYNLIVNVLKKLNIDNGVVLSLTFDNEDINSLSYIMFSFGIYGSNFKVSYLLNDNLDIYNICNCSMYKYSDDEIEDIAKSIYLDKSYVFGLDAFNNDRKLIRK